MVEPQGMRSRGPETTGAGRGQLKQGSAAGEEAGGPNGRMTTKQFARRVGVTPHTVYTWIREGRIHPWKIAGRWRYGPVHLLELVRR